MVKQKRDFDEKLRFISLVLFAVLISISIVCCSGGGSGGDSGGGSGGNSGAGDDSECPAAILESKQVDFHNTWQPNVTVQVYEYDLACPDAPFLDPSDIAWSQGSPGYDYDAHLLLPQGRYSACIDWWDDDDSTYLYKIYGDLPDDPLFILDEYTNETVPPEIFVSPEYPIDGTGRCPNSININGGDGGDSNDGGDGASSGIEVQLIGNDGETAIYSPTPQQIADADITLSGSLNSLTIDWKLEDVIAVSVARGSGIVYAIVGSLDGFGDPYVIDPPITYGNYSIPNTEISGAPSPAPNLEAGVYYTITIGTSYQESSYIGFIISN